MTVVGGSVVSVSDVDGQIPVLLVPSTPDEQVNAVISVLEQLPSLPLREQTRLFEEIHQGLQDRLTQSQGGAAPRVGPR